MPKPRKRKNPNALEQNLGVRGLTAGSAVANDMFSNFAARSGFGTQSLGQGSEYTLVRFSYDFWAIITLYRNHWLSRRIIDVPAQDYVKAWPKLTSEIEPKDLTRIDRALRKTNTKNNVLTGLTWGRLFGGAGGLIVIDGQENELDQPLDLESVKIGAYKGILPFDMWSGIHPAGDVCTDINRPLDFGRPENYTVTPTGGASFKVHSSRVLRFTGPSVPTPEKEAQMQWGISVLEPIYESITRLDNMYANLLNLSFRANLIGMKFPDLAQLLSGLGSSQVASQKFEQRMSSLNSLMSNQSLIPLPADGGIEQTQYSFSGMSDVLQLFQLDIAGAAQIPITRLFGRTYNGLGQAGDGDEMIYSERIATDQSVYLTPQLEKLYPVLCMSELGEVPDDLDLVCPSIRVLDEKEKSELAKSVADTVTVYLNSGIMSPRVVAREVKQSSDMTGIGTNLTDEFIAKLSDSVASEGELGEGLFGGEGAGLGEADSPAKAIKSENKTGQGEDPEDPAAKNDEPSAKELLAKKAGKPSKTAPAMDTLPAGLKRGEKILVGGKLLTVASIGDAVEDLDGETAVPVRFVDGTVVAYARVQDALPRDLIYGPFTDKVEAEHWLKKVRTSKQYDMTRVSRWGTVPTREQEARGMYIGDVRLSVGWGVFGEKKTKATDSIPTFEKCGNPVWRICTKCSGHLHRSECKVTLDRVRDCVCSAGLEHGSSTYEVLHGHATDADGASAANGATESIRETHGLRTRVETPVGRLRSGFTPDGRAWSVTMPAHYGFIDGILGADGDSLDCYIGTDPESATVWVVDQHDIDGTGFDEHKVFLSFANQAEALETYMLGHHLSRKTYAAITEFTMAAFKKWMANHDMAEPCDPGVE
jgi:hypothetical protein